MELDLNLRVRVAALEAHLARLDRPGLLETSPGVRSVTIEYDAARLPLAQLLQLLEDADAHLPLVRLGARLLLDDGVTVSMAQGATESTAWRAHKPPVAGPC